VSWGVSFFLQTPIFTLYGTGTDARFPYEVRQNVVIGLVVVPIWEQEVPGSNPGAPTQLTSAPATFTLLPGFLLD